MNADCSVGNNPLMQLDKQTQKDNSLIQGYGTSKFGLSNNNNNLNLSEQFRSNESARHVQANNQNFINSFINIGGSNLHNVPKGESNMSYLNPNIPSDFAKQTNWTSQFQNTADYNTVNKDWLNDFNHAAPNKHLQMNHSGHQDMSQLTNPSYNIQNRMMQNITNNNFMMNNRSRNIDQKNQNIMKEGWDEKFKELEKEVSENLKLHDEADFTDEVEKNGETNEADEVTEDYRNAFQEAWDSISKDAEDLLPNGLNPDAWETEHQNYLYNKLKQPAEYTFSNTNEFMHNPNAYEIGCMLMENGAKLSEAALSFESAVQEDPNHVDAWLKLGLVQTQNEKEAMGIIALEKCLQLDPKNLDAMKNLAISYINEGFDVSAFTMLNRWIETKYSTLLDPTDSIQMDSEQNRYKLNEIVTKQFLKIANKLPNADADVQLGLGLLFYSNNEFEKTIDCFKTALVIHPEDELMWNRLGASLANSSRCEEAIQAYHKALQLKPSFVRARYNLAVSSINIGCYKEAAEHLLTSLRMHEVDGVNNNSSLFTGNSSNGDDNILETLKRTFIAMGRQDLFEHVHPGMKLDYFKKDFNF